MVGYWDGKKLGEEQVCEGLSSDGCVIYLLNIVLEFYKQ